VTEVKEILARVDKLPPMPAVVQQILATLQDPNYSFSDLLETVRLDPGITAHVINMCNSPYYGLRQKVSSLQQAMLLLGSQQLMEIILSGKMVGHFQKGQSGYRLSRGALWQHCMATALMAQTLGERLKYPDLPTLFTAALMHDVGKLVLSEYVAKEFTQIEQMVEMGQAFADAERQVLGVDHALLGGAVARKWNFPDNIVAAIAFHHNPGAAAAEHRHLANLVALANLICISLGVGAGAEGLAAVVSPALLKDVGLRSRDLDILLLELKDILDKAADLLALAS
jgi:putative nucleotidyltransferase with HDIG domain